LLRGATSSRSFKQHLQQVQAILTLLPLRQSDAPLQAIVSTA
jgi:hypothetical protein